MEKIKAPSVPEKRPLLATIFSGMRSSVSKAAKRAKARREISAKLGAEREKEKRKQTLIRRRREARQKALDAKRREEEKKRSVQEEKRIKVKIDELREKLVKGSKEPMGG